jgi:hypothetical protein
LAKFQIRRAWWLYASFGAISSAFHPMRFGRFQDPASGPTIDIVHRLNFSRPSVHVGGIVHNDCKIPQVIISVIYCPRT